MSDKKILATTVLALAGALAAGTAHAAATPAAAAGATRELTVDGGLAATIKQAGNAERGPVWFAWEVPAAPAVRSACCFDRSFSRGVCNLEGRNQSWGTSDDSPPPSGRLVVLARWSGGGVGRVRAVSSSCGVDAGTVPIVRLRGVSPADSIAYLVGLVEGADRRGELDEALAAIAYHGGAPADEALQRLAAADRPEKQREQALFWIGQTRGEVGARFLAGVSRSDPSPDIREKAVFSLSQSEAPSAIPAIIAVARQDGDPEVRGQALFWLAQSGADSAPQVILARLDEDPSADVREKAVFAISQLEGDQAVPLLVRIARERRDPDIRRQAIFWLGQSSDPRAMDFLEKILE